MLAVLYCHNITSGLALGRRLVATPSSPFRLADKTQAAEPEVEHKQRINGQSDPVLENAAAAEDADAGG